MLGSTFCLPLKFIGALIQYSVVFGHFKISIMPELLGTFAEL
jgi:hypothetical protein